MEKREKIYEGKAKILYGTEDPKLLIQSFKDSATALDGKKKGLIEDKGVWNNKISAKVFEYLESKRIKTHFVKTLSEREMLVKRLEMIPLEMVVRNTATGSITRRLGIEEGTSFKPPVLEYYLKNDSLGDPMLNRSHIRVLGLAKEEEMKALDRLSLKINEVLIPFFLERKIKLVDFKLEFGVMDGKILLGDEISPDTCRFWDAQSKTIRRLDKDLFRKDLGGEREAYLEVFRRICE